MDNKTYKKEYSEEELIASLESFQHVDAPKELLRGILSRLPVKTQKKSIVSMYFPTLGYAFSNINSVQKSGIAFALIFVLAVGLVYSHYPSTSTDLSNSIGSTIGLPNTIDTQAPRIVAMSTGGANNSSIQNNVTDMSSLENDLSNIDQEMDALNNDSTGADQSMDDLSQV